MNLLDPISLNFVHLSFAQNYQLKSLPPKMSPYFPSVLFILLSLFTYNFSAQPELPELPEELSKVELQKCLLFFYFYTSTLDADSSLREEILSKV
jgi:hypothetical protein